MTTEETVGDKPEIAELVKFHGVVHSGDVLVIESTRKLTVEEVAQLQKQFGEIHSKFGVGVILLDDVFRVAGVRP